MPAFRTHPTLLAENLLKSVFRRFIVCLDKLFNNIVCTGLLRLPLRLTQSGYRLGYKSIE